MMPDLESTARHPQADCNPHGTPHDSMLHTSTTGGMVCVGTYAIEGGKWMTQQPSGRFNAGGSAPFFTWSRHTTVS